MTPTSATKSGAAQIAEVLSLVSRRASHEVRNALNAVAVNIEVVRSRLSRPGSDLSELQAFADRASKESDSAASLANGLADLTRILALAASSEGKPVFSRGDGSTTIEVPLGTSDDNIISADLKLLASRMGVSMKLSGSAVIFTVRD